MLALGLAFGSALLVKALRGGELKDGIAVAVIERVQVPPAKTPPQEVAPPRADATNAETASGVTIIRQNGGVLPGSNFIRVPDAKESASVRESTPLAPAPDPRVSERGTFGLLPQMGEGGLTPATLYARPFASTGKPVVAVVLTGVGMSAKGTADAIARLPGTITLAFAPYGRDLEMQVQRARRDGHEVLLQVPMEPFDYPDNDPGPHTLRAASSVKDNAERLAWLMSRFSGYVGLLNYMGGKLMASPQAYQPVLEEMQKRGLLFIEDGSVNKGQSLEIARKILLPALRADRAFETDAAGPGLRAFLAGIEVQARKTGRAVITLPALPANIDALAEWAGELETRGITLAPVSALVAGVPKS